MNYFFLDFFDFFLGGESSTLADSVTTSSVFSLSFLLFLLFFGATTSSASVITFSADFSSLHFFFFLVSFSSPGGVNFPGEVSLKNCTISVTVGDPGGSSPVTFASFLNFIASFGSIF